MLNQQALDSLYSATYMEDYLDCMENLPDDIQRYISRMRDLDIQYRDYMQDLESSMEELLTELDKKEPVDGKKRAVFREELQKKKWRAQEALMRAQDIGDEKLQLAQNVQDNVENKARQLELDKKNLGELTKLRPREYGREMESQDPVKDDRNIKRARRARHEVFVPSILGPSTLEVTSFVDSSIHDSHPGPSTSRNVQISQPTVEKLPSRSQAATEKVASSSAAASVSSYDNPKAGPSTCHQVDEPRPFGRGSERATGSSTRGAAEKVETDGGNQSRASERPSTTAASIITPKKQSQKAQNNEKKYKKRKAKQTRNHDASPPDPIDPDEPTYCLCDQISYGEMIGCDNDLCPIEWFHFSCVNLTHKPKGKWYCPKCRGDKPNIMKSKALFLKELEKYNREKEEKA